jgi:hypothetical protein
MEIAGDVLKGECQPKHANLTSDMIPVSRGVQFLSQDTMQLTSHVNYTVSHRFDVFLPLGEEFRVVHDKRHLKRELIND